MKDRLTELNSILSTISNMLPEAEAYRDAKGYRGGTIVSKVKASKKALTELVDNIQKTVGTSSASKPVSSVKPNTIPPQVSTKTTLEQVA